MQPPSMERTLFFTVSLMLAVGCRSSGVPERHPAQGEAGAPQMDSVRDRAPMPSATLENTEWKLVELSAQPVRVAEGLEAPNLRLDGAQKQASGSGGCNRFTGRYELGGDSLRLGPLASTRRACLDPETSQREKAFLVALDGTRTWQVTGDTLVLSSGAEPLARLAAQ